MLPADLTEEFLTPLVARADGGPGGQGFGLEFNDVGYYKEGESEGASRIFSLLSVWNADIVILSNTMDGTGRSSASSYGAPARLAPTTLGARDEQAA